MSKTIWKYPVILSVGWIQTLPKRSHVLSVGVQDNRPFMWVMHEGTDKAEARKFSVYGTGHEIRQYPGRFVGTFQLESLVFHFFEDGVVHKASWADAVPDTVPDLATPSTSWAVWAWQAYRDKRLVEMVREDKSDG